MGVAGAPDAGNDVDAGGGELLSKADVARNMRLAAGDGRRGGGERHGHAARSEPAAKARMRELGAVRGAHGIVCLHVGVKAPGRAKMTERFPVSASVVSSKRHKCGNPDKVGIASGAVSRQRRATW